jgi:hypothetical protein
MTYCDYLSIKEDFIDVFSEEADSTQPFIWRTFIPHKVVKKILAKLLDALERGKPIDNKSLWIQGPYGTGKTFGSFFLKHILEDDLKEIEKYFQSYDDMQDVWKRLEAIRKSGEYIIVYRSSTSHINSSFKFLVEVQQAIKKAIKKKGSSDVFDETIFEPIYKKLTQSDSTFNWDKAFNNYRNKFLEFKSSQEVIDHLTPENINLLQRVADVLEKENIIIIDNVHVVKEWIKKIIKNNNLKGIVFIWDEFSDFFINSNSTEALQELAQLTTETPFYFILITHKKIDILFKNDKENQNKISNRFHSFHFEMEPITAYQLMKNSIIIDNSKDEAWTNCKSNLWSKVERKTTDLMTENVTKKDFKDLIPIHPYSAYLLAMITDQLSSSQRTLTKFLKQDNENSFYHFIKEYPKNDWYWLTIDTLWDYFFTEDNYELTEPVKEIYSYYCSRNDHIEDSNEKKVFKSIILLFALSKEVPGNKLLKPSLSNLKLAYSGTPLLEDLEKIKDELKKVELIREIPSGKEIEFTISTKNIDERRLIEIKRNLQPFKKEIKPIGEIGKKIYDLFFPTSGSNKRRVVLNLISINEFKDSKGSSEAPIGLNQISAVIIFVQDDTELLEANKIIKNFKPKNKSTIILVAQLPFGKINWDRWIDQKANHQYYKEHQDIQNAHYHEIQIKIILDEWVESLQKAKFKVYFQQEELEIVGKEGFEKFLSESISIIFPCGPEKISTKGTLYTIPAGVAVVKIGMGLNPGKLTEPYKSLMNDLKQFGDIDKDETFQKNINHPLYQANLKVANLFQEKENLNLNEIWSELQKPPFGYLDSPICSVVMGILFRQYSRGYYYFDGANTSPIIPDKMADFINETMKFGKNQIVLSKITPEDEAFCALIREIFEFQAERTKEPLTALQEIRNYLKNIGYPIWALKYSIQETTESPVVKKIFDEIQERIRTINTSNLKPTNGLLENHKSIIKSLLISDCFRLGMANFVNQNQPKLFELINTLNIDISSLSSQMKLMMMEEVYLWTEEKVNISLIQILSNYEMIESLNQISNTKGNNLVDASNNFQNWLNKVGKLPLFIIANAQSPQIQEIIINLNSYLFHNDKTKGDPKLSKSLREQREIIIKAIQDQNNALKIWIKRHFNEEFSQEEIQNIIENLPQLTSNINIEQVNSIIKNHLDLLTTRTLVKEVLNKWLEISETKSPIIWCHDNKTPIQWVFEGEEYNKLFNIINEPQYNSIVDLEWALEFLQKNQSNIKLIHNIEFVNKRFVSFIASEYEDLINEKMDITQLKHYLSENCQYDVYSWSNHFTTIKAITLQWIEKMYKEKTYSEVIQKIGGMSDSQVKNSIVDLVKDPLIGSKFLKRGS